MNYKFIEKFNECWIPDYASANNLAGELSHPESLPQTKVKYIGPLSRFERKKTATTWKYKFLVIISGPEPQRTLFEKMITQQLPGLNEDG